MKTIIQHDTYGEIYLDESFWSGKKTFYIGGVPLIKTGRNQYEFVKDGENYTALVRGNFLTGVTMNIRGQDIRLTPKPAWYEIFLSVLILAFNLVWANVPSLFLLMPLVGGAVGGLIGGVFTMASLLFMKSTKNIFLKLLIFALCFAASVLISWLIAVGILAAAGA